ncbi:unnamed protein product [Echinostoma caproni]|uniref:Uncharacterized protein n=1 Tax=Echinostoma caproni TaxID=27848 RepID=A0A183AXX1_9TREM|nr:unnamed protein product [Echinostoma caproni]
MDNMTIVVIKTRINGSGDNDNDDDDDDGDDDDDDDDDDEHYIAIDDVSDIKYDYSAAADVRKRCRSIKRIRSIGHREQSINIGLIGLVRWCEKGTSQCGLAHSCFLPPGSALFRTPLHKRKARRSLCSWHYINQTCLNASSSCLKGEGKDWSVPQSSPCMALAPFLKVDCTFVYSMK